MLPVSLFLHICLKGKLNVCMQETKNVFPLPTTSHILVLSCCRGQRSYILSITLQSDHGLPAASSITTLISPATLVTDRGESDR